MYDFVEKDDVCSYSPFSLKLANRVFVAFQ
jgi:hypothetical protein